MPKKFIDVGSESSHFVNVNEEFGDNESGDNFEMGDFGSEDADFGKAPRAIMKSKPKGAMSASAMRLSSDQRSLSAPKMIAQSRPVAKPTPKKVAKPAPRVMGKINVGVSATSAALIQAKKNQVGSTIHKADRMSDYPTKSKIMDGVVAHAPDKDWPTQNTSTQAAKIKKQKAQKAKKKSGGIVAGIKLPNIKLPNFGQSKKKAKVVKKPATVPATVVSTGGPLTAPAVESGKIKVNKKTAHPLLGFNKNYSLEGLGMEDFDADFGYDVEEFGLDASDFGAGPQMGDWLSDLKKKAQLELDRAKTQAVTQLKSNVSSELSKAGLKLASDPRVQAAAKQAAVESAVTGISTKIYTLGEKWKALNPAMKAGIVGGIGLGVYLLFFAKKGTAAKIASNPIGAVLDIMSNPSKKKKAKKAKKARKTRKSRKAKKALVVAGPKKRKTRKKSRKSVKKTHKKVAKKVTRKKTRRVRKSRKVRRTKKSRK